jgi:hypothetical protein
MVAVYGTPTVASGSVESVSLSDPGAIVILIGPVIVLIGVLESVTVTVKSVVPAVVGVPVMAQFEPRANPAGSEPVTRAQA